jgi:hypothetical protein
VGEHAHGGDVPRRAGHEGSSAPWTWSGAGSWRRWRPCSRRRGPGRGSRQVKGGGVDEKRRPQAWALGRGRGMMRAVMSAGAMACWWSHLVARMVAKKSNKQRMGGGGERGQAWGPVRSRRALGGRWGGQQRLGVGWPAPPPGPTIPPISNPRTTCDRWRRAWPARAWWGPWRARFGLCEERRFRGGRGGETGARPGRRPPPRPHQRRARAWAWRVPARGRPRRPARRPGLPAARGAGVTRPRPPAGGRAAGRPAAGPVGRVPCPGAPPTHPGRPQ